MDFRNPQILPTCLFTNICFSMICDIAWNDIFLWGVHLLTGTKIIIYLLKKVSWKFSATSHGKGVVDGGEG